MRKQPGRLRSALRTGTLVGATLASALLPGCQRSADKQVSDTVTLAVRADVTGFFPNPPMANEGYTQEINWNILEGLSGFDGGYRLVPALAGRWHNPDPQTYVFELRPGLLFSDGSPVTANDVVASLRAHKERPWVFSDFLQAIETVDVDSEGRIVIHTRSPYLVLLYKLPWGMILPRAVLGQSPIPIIGTGPYRLTSWTPGREFVLSRNKFYRGPAPDFETARFNVEPDADARIDLLLSGRADVADQVPLGRIAELRKRPEVRVHAGPGNRVLFLGLRMDRVPFSDPRVREAMDLAIDRNELIERALFGQGQVASQIVPSSIVGFEPQIKDASLDRERARRLLVEAGLPQDTTLHLAGTRNRYVNDEQILHEIARQLALVGLRVEVDALDKRDFFRRWGNDEFDFFMLGWACSSGEAGEALDPLFHSPNGGLGGNNRFGLSDVALDGLIEQANSSTTLEERLGHIQQALRRVDALRPIVPLVVQPEAVAVARGIRWDPPVNYAFRLDSLRRDKE